LTTALLIEMTKAGSDLALADLFRAHRRFLVAFAEEKWKMGADAEDAAQQVFMRLRESLEHYEHRSDREFRSFLMALAEQECRKLKRTWKRRVKPCSQSLDDPDFLKAGVASSGSEADACLTACVQEIIGKVSEQQRGTLDALLQESEEEPNHRVAAARRQFEKIWNAEPGEIVTPQCKKLNEEDVIKICVLARDGEYTHAEIAGIFGITRSYVGNIVAGRARFLRYKDQPKIALIPNSHGPCRRERSCVFPGIFNGMCRTHRLDSEARYSLSRPNAGGSWLRSNVQHAHWDSKVNFIGRHRSRRGSKHGHVFVRRSHRQKLREEDVRKIRRLRREEGLSMGKIARRFGVGETCIRDVLTGKRFADVLDIETGTEAAVSAAWVRRRQIFRVRALPLVADPRLGCACPFVRPWNYAAVASPESRVASGQTILTTESQSRGENRR